MESQPNPNIESQTNHVTAPEGHDALVLRDRAIKAQRAGGVAVHIAMDDARVQTLTDLLTFFAPDIEILVFPAWDCLPYDRISPNTSIIGQRIETLTKLNARMTSDIKKPMVVLTTINAAIRKIICPADLPLLGGILIQNNHTIDESELLSFLTNNGYERVDTVRETGDFAVRGGLIDLWPTTLDAPVRLDLFGDEVESIKTFDPVSQRSDTHLDHLSLQAASEIPLNDESIARFRSRYRELFGAVNNNDPLYEAVTHGRRLAGMEHWQPLFFNDMGNLFDYTPDALISLDHQSNIAIDEAFEQITDFYQARITLAEQTVLSNKKNKTNQQVIYHPVPVEMTFEQLNTDLQNPVTFSPFSVTDSSVHLGHDFADIRALPDGDVFAAVKDYLFDHKNKKALICAYSTGARDRLQGLLEAHDIAVKPIDRFDQAKKGHISLITLPLARGFINDDLITVTEQDILGDRLVRKSAARKRKADAFLREVSSLNHGDYVVHIDHGIGRFEGLETLDIGGAQHDCVRLVYDGGDKLYIPVENIELLSRYGDADSNAVLDKLGGAGWQARRASVKRNLLEMAGKLIDIAAARALQKSDVYKTDDTQYQQFAASFPYHETEDQLASIESVLTDLESGKPMDRLVCGDVGFGKTEVAIRAAYVTAMAGGQVAVIAPTTLLARQHYENFKNRFQGTPLAIANLSRLVTAKEAKQVKKNLEDGSINIVIGTHALLADSITFNHLGLVIIDEEQRFGVKQKERLKDLAKNVHVLTLTATPIPRTLQMALTGVRDLSLITTPPVDRLAIRSFVMPFDPVVIREALLREHHRGGQSFIVCPRVKDIAAMEETIKELIPEIKLIAAHGQMPASDLDERMTAFYDKQYDVLLATNIIESGIDVPSANTMIVHRADMFGLAQLYQIRGRIGRSKLRAYAYLTYQPNVALNPTAIKRLEVIGALDTLGAGFQLASHDMDQRGAGNLVGEQQSGHIKEVGVELYQQMLEEAVAAAREGVTLTDSDNTLTQDWSPDINLGTSIMIPESYITDLSVRMGLYRRLASLSEHNEIESFAAEMIDRFGALPDEVENLLQVMTIKHLCKRAQIAHVEAGPKGVLIGFYNDQPKNPAALMQFIQDKAGTVKIRPDQKLFFPRGWISVDQRVTGTRQILNDLVKL